MCTSELQPHYNLLSICQITHIRCYRRRSVDQNLKSPPLLAINFRGKLHVFNCRILRPYVSHITQWGTLKDISEIALGGIKSSRIYPPDTETKSRRWHLLQILTVSSLAQPAVNHWCRSHVLCSGFMCGFIFTYSWFICCSNSARNKNQQSLTWYYTVALHSTAYWLMHTAELFPASSRRFVLWREGVCSFNSFTKALQGDTG